MSDLVTSFTVFRDILLLLVNIGMLVMLFIIAGQMNGQRQRSKTIPKQVTDLLEKILASQRKAASALATSNNEFRNHLKTMVINVEGTEIPQTGTNSPTNSPPLGDFKSLRRDVERMETYVNETLSGLQSLSRESTDALNKLVSGIHGDRQADRDLVNDFQNTLRADLESHADRIQGAIDQLPAKLPISTANDGETVQITPPSVDLATPLNKWFSRAQELHKQLVGEIRSIGEKFSVSPPTDQLSQAADRDFAQLRKILESFMIENARHDKQTEEFQRSLRADFQAQANLLGKAVAEMPARGEAPATGPMQLGTTALDDSLKEWLGRTRELHESLIHKIQETPHAGGNGNGSSTDLAVQSLRHSLTSHQESMQKLLADFVAESIRQSQSAEEFRSEMRDDFRNQTDLLSRALSDMARQGQTSSVSDAENGHHSNPVQIDLEGPFSQWIERTQKLHEGLIGEVKNATRQFHFPTDEFRQITDQHHDSLRKLLEDWTDESIRRVRATDELRAAIQQDVKTQAERLRLLVESQPRANPTTAMHTTGTVTTSVTDAESREWRDTVQSELQKIIAKLDRMHNRMEEIFQI